MILATAKILISTEECSSLKEKRQIVLSMKDRLRKNFNLSIAEVDFQNNCQQGVIGLACVSNDAGHANGLISKAINFLEQSYPGRIVDYQFNIDIK
ncbi:MAG: DUF503 domain-containing protein [Spirochaetota bacterium]|nr:DUF503 domain-containing protein [Spirochaetota bacterium]